MIPDLTVISAADIVRTFYGYLREEVTGANPHLTPSEQAQLQSHYGVMMHPDSYPIELAATIYTSRRKYPVSVIQNTDNPVVFDAGCGYGSESFLFAAVGARVLAVDISEEQITIARKRQAYYEELFVKPLDITFVVADLNAYTPDFSDLSLTWFASVLAAIPDQSRLLSRAHAKTRSGGQIMISDMNLYNPLFLWRECRRRQRAKRLSATFAKQASFWHMFRRKGRIGARYFPFDAGRGHFDDVQFFSADTLERVLEKVGFSGIQKHFSGYLPPFLFNRILSPMESLLSKVPMLRTLGYFYLVSGIRE